MIGSSPTPTDVNKLDRRHIGRLRERQLSDRREGGGGGGAKSFGGKKAWSSINHKILFGIKHQKRLHRALALWYLTLVTTLLIFNYSKLPAIETNRIWLIVVVLAQKTWIALKHS